MTTIQAQQEQNGNAISKKKTRSPAYPSIDLADALQRAEVLRKAEGKNATNVETALLHWGHKPKSGTGLTALSALIKYGLLHDEGKGDERRVSLTPLSMKILLDDRPESPERLAAVREAALMPSIYKELWEKYQGALPSDNTLRFYLRHDRGFQDDAAGWCIENLRATLTYARLPESANISPKAEDKQQPEGELKMTPPPTMTPNVDTEAETEKASEGQAVAHTMRTIQIPLTNAPWAMIQVPYPMSEVDWAELTAWLESMASPLTKGKAKPQKKLS